MRFNFAIIVAAGILLTSGEVFGSELKKGATLNDGQVGGYRLLRVHETPDENEERITRATATAKLKEATKTAATTAGKVTGVTKLTNYLNMKTLEYWLSQDLSTKEVFKRLGLRGYGGRAYKKPKHKWFLEYVNMYNAKHPPAKAEPVPVPA